MKGEVAFNIEWQDPGGARGETHRATWARLEILVGGVSVTQLDDEISMAVRHAIYLPLYPLAEWLASHWWFLFYEPWSPGRDPMSYERRHDIRWASEGFALPSLQIKPLGKIISLEWRPAHRAAQKVRFTRQGHFLAERGELLRSLSAFIEVVITRLESRGVTNTQLSEDWTEISQASGEEAEFCKAAAALGVDPYTSEEEQDRILQAASSVPAPLTTEFFAAATSEYLQQQTGDLAQALQHAHNHSLDLKRIKVFQPDLMDTTRSSPLPWQQGLSTARRLRQKLGLNGQALPSLDHVGQVLDISSRDIRAAILPLNPSHPAFDALAEFNKQGVLGLAIRERKRETGTLFSFCRVLFESLMQTDRSPLIVTAAHSERQQRSRAFAAEFLAPEDALRDSVSGPNVDAEELEELAARFGVSTFVIKHQLENHGIATVLAE